MKQLENKHILMEESFLYEGLRLHDLFWQDLSNSQFYLSVEYGGEVAEAALGADPAFAAGCYQAVREGGVTPCTLVDVIADLRAESEKSTKNALQILMDMV